QVRGIVTVFWLSWPLHRHRFGQLDMIGAVSGEYALGTGTDQLGKYGRSHPQKSMGCTLGPCQAPTLGTACLPTTRPGSPRAGQTRRRPRRTRLRSPGALLTLSRSLTRLQL